MIHVVLRILVWVAVLGGALLLFGPEVFDSGRNANPVGSNAPLYLPPAKSAQLLAWEAKAADGVLGAEDRAAYAAGVRAWRARFWSGTDTSVEALLEGVNTGRQAHLVEVLKARGLAEDEVAVFLAVVTRDRPDLLQDQSSQPISR